MICLCDPNVGLSLNCDMDQYKMYINDTDLEHGYFATNLKILIS